MDCPGEGARLLSQPSLRNTVIMQHNACNYGKWFPFSAKRGRREGEKAVCSEGQHSGPGLVLNRLCRVRPGPRWDRLSPPQALSGSIQGLQCPPDSAWGRLRGQSFLDAWCHGAYGHPHTTDLCVCPLPSPRPFRETGRCPACHIRFHCHSSLEHVRGHRVPECSLLRVSRSLFLFQSDSLSIPHSGPRAPTQGWQEVRVQGVSPTP